MPSESGGQAPESGPHRTAVSPRRWAMVAAASCVLGLVAIRLLPDAGPEQGNRPTTRQPSGSTTAGSQESGSPILESGDVELRFTDVTERSGLSFLPVDQFTSELTAFAGGVAVVDYDNDDDLDVFFPRFGAPNALMRNDNERFVDVGRAAGVAGGPENTNAAATWADVNGDGDQDLWITSATRDSSVLFVSRGDGTFRDETEARGLSMPTPAKSGAGRYQSAFADWDQDGDLDLLTLHWDTTLFETPEAQRFFEERSVSSSEPDVCDLTRELETVANREASANPNLSRAFLNDGTGRFTDATAQLGLDLRRTLAFSAVFSDIDVDGWPDLIIAGDACTSRLYRNVNGGRFEDITGASGLATDENGMGLAVQDIDGDGRFDIFVTSIAYPTRDGSCPAPSPFTACSGNRLFLGRSGGVFEDLTDRWGVRDGGWGWGVEAEDLDNDGRRDLLMTNGSRFDLPPTMAERTRMSSYFADLSRLWINVGDTPLPEAAQITGLDHRGQGRALATFDFDKDGDLDVLIVDVEEGPRLFRNDTPPSHWLEVQVDDPSRPGNRGGVGAHVRVTRGNQEWVGEIRTSGSFGTQPPPILHIGLGSDPSDVDRIEVRWDAMSPPTVVEGIQSDQRTTVRRVV